MASFVMLAMTSGVGLRVVWRMPKPFTGKRRENSGCHEVLSGLGGVLMARGACWSHRGVLPEVV